jgi:hypothetical protein
MQAAVDALTLLPIPPYPESVCNMLPCTTSLTGGLDYPAAFRHPQAKLQADLRCPGAVHRRAESVAG